MYEHVYVFEILSRNWISSTDVMNNTLYIKHIYQQLYWGLGLEMLTKHAVFITPGILCLHHESSCHRRVHRLVPSVDKGTPNV